jgi:hypothetical protein
MPCSSSDGMGRDRGEDYDARRDIKDLAAKNDELTQVLCAVLRAVDGAQIPIPEIAKEWYRKHREWDKSQGRG